MTVLAGILSADFALTAGDNPVWRVRSNDPFTVDGKEADLIEPKTSSPYYQYKMTPAQSEAFDALTASEDFDPESDTLTLPDGGHRGRNVTRGQSLAAIVAARRSATSDEKPAKR